MGLGILFKYRRLRLFAKRADYLQIFYRKITIEFSFAVPTYLYRVFIFCHNIYKKSYINKAKLVRYNKYGSRNCRQYHKNPHFFEREFLGRQKCYGIFVNYDKNNFSTSNSLLSNILCLIFFLLIMIYFKIFCSFFVGFVSLFEVSLFIIYSLRPN